jgi:hypothetical protein
MLEVNHRAIAASRETEENFVGGLDTLGYSKFFEVRPFSGPHPLKELFASGRRDVRNIIVTKRDALLKVCFFLLHTGACLEPFLDFC